MEISILTWIEKAELTASICQIEIFLKSEIQLQFQKMRKRRLQLQNKKLRRAMRFTKTKQKVSDDLGVCVRYLQIV